MQGVVRFLITALLQIYYRIFRWKKMWKSATIWQKYGHEFASTDVCFFTDHSVS